MSIYSSLFYLPDEDNEPNLPAPIVYHHSGHYPEPNKRGGWLDVAVPPPYSSEDEEGEGYCPYLRISVSESDVLEPSCVVIDVAQVDSLIEALQDWRARVVQPKDTPPDAEGGNP